MDKTENMERTKKLTVSETEIEFIHLLRNATREGSYEAYYILKTNQKEKRINIYQFNQLKNR